MAVTVTVQEEVLLLKAKVIAYKYDPIKRSYLDYNNW